MLVRVQLGEFKGRVQKTRPCSFTGQGVGQPAVPSGITQEFVQKAHASGRKVGICGEAPSNYPDFAAWLAGIGIDSMSLNPDALPGVARTLASSKDGAIGSRGQLLPM